MSVKKTATTRFTLDAKLVALRDAAQIGADAIEHGDFIALENEQDIANLVRQAGEQAGEREKNERTLKKRLVFLSKQLANASV